MVFLVCFSVLTTSSGLLANAPAENYYQIKIYHYRSQAQENKIDQYLKQAYLPALHRAGINEVGVFKPVSQEDTDRRIYVFTPFRSMDKLLGADQRLQADAQYMADSKDYADADHLEAPYSRVEIIILWAFPGMPSPAVPRLTAAKTDRVYELRSYESPTEKYNLNKVQMFNAGGEIALFNRLGFNAVFYAEVLAGSHMPNMMYMTTFNSKEDRDKHWETFGGNPEWKATAAKPEYKNNVSHSDIILLHPAEYSDF
jgi:hypothetical protein